MFQVILRSTFCPLFALNRSFGNNKRWRMVNYTLERSFDRSAQTRIGSILLMARFWLSKGKKSEKPINLNTINRQNRLFL